MKTWLEIFKSHAADRVTFNVYVREFEFIRLKKQNTDK